MISHVSYSQLGTYVRCSKQYQLSRIKQAPTTPAVWLPAGSAVHEAIELVNKRHYERENANGHQATD